ncbi:MAG: hypothetical protein WCW26_02005 [Candidatus Buchananbacteria bacterium]
MTVLNDLGSIFSTSFIEIWLKFVNLIPNLLGAILLFIVGLFLANTFGRLVSQIVKKIYIDRAVETTGLKKILEGIGFKLEVSKALGLLVAWFLYAVVLIAAADILGLSQISEFLSAVVLYLPNVFIAIIILIVGIVVANFVHTLVKETALAAKLAAADFLATVAKWSLLVFTIMAALIQLQVASDLIKILFAGLVFMVSMAGGIAFGLGGKDKAKEFIDKLIGK